MPADVDRDVEPLTLPVGEAREVLIHLLHAGEQILGVLVRDRGGALGEMLVEQRLRLGRARALLLVVFVVVDQRLQRLVEAADRPLHAVHMTTTFSQRLARLRERQVPPLALMWR